MFPRVLPPAGVRFGPSHIGEAVAAAVGPAWKSKERARSFADALSRYFGGREIILTGSGRTGLLLALQELSRGRPDRPEVVIPAYTCYSVAATVERAGLRVRLVDLEPGTLGMAPEALAGTQLSRVLAVVSGNLFGIPDRLPELRAITERAGATFIDDAAQAVGSGVFGAKVGVHGAVGVLSFGRGKPLTALGGGALVVANPILASRLRQRVQELPNTGRSAGVRGFFRAAAYSIALHPRVFSLPSRFLDLGRTIYDPGFSVEAFPSSLGGLGATGLGILEHAQSERSWVAQHLVRRLHALPGITLPFPTRWGVTQHANEAGGDDASVSCPQPPPGEMVAWNRMPILLDDGMQRDRALRELKSAGMGATQYYPQAIGELPAARRILADPNAPTPVAESTARRLLTLPTHGWVTREDLDRMASILSEVGPGTA